MAPELVKVASLLLHVLLAGWLFLCALVNGIVLSALDWVEEGVGGTLDALEELIVLFQSQSGLLVGVMLQDLLSVGPLDLVFCSLPSELLQAENSVVILRFPVLGLTLKVQRIVKIVDVIVSVLFDLLDVLLGLEFLVLVNVSRHLRLCNLQNIPQKMCACASFCGHGRDSEARQAPEHAGWALKACQWA